MSNSQEKPENLKKKDPNTTKTAIEDFRTTEQNSLGILAGGIAHDFNNVLMAIMGNIELLKMEKGVSPESNEYIEDIQKATLEARQIASQLMQFAKGHKPRRSPTDVIELIESTAQSFFAGKKVAYSIKKKGDLPIIELDPNQISKAIKNILTILEPSLGENDHVAIVVAARHQPWKFKDQELTTEFLEIYLGNEGAERPESHHFRIYNPYEKTKEADRGLEWVLVHRIIKNHDGTITFVSNPKGRASFVIHLPIIGKIERPSVSKAISKELTELKLLIMDDEQLLQTTLLKLFQKYGFEVEIASNGYDAIKKYTKAVKGGKPFDLVVLDLTIPGSLGGKETFEKLREKYPDIQCIVSSGYTDSPILKNYKKYGFVGVLNKPYTGEELKRELQQILKTQLEK